MCDGKSPVLENTPGESKHSASRFAGQASGPREVKSNIECSSEDEKMPGWRTRRKSTGVMDPRVRLEGRARP